MTSEALISSLFRYFCTGEGFFFCIKDSVLIDPACGTGVFVVETVKQMSAFLSFDELIKFVENNMFAYDVNPFSVIATKISVLNTLLEIAPDSVHKNNLLLGIPALNNIKWKNTIVDKEEKEF